MRPSESGGDETIRILPKPRPRRAVWPLVAAAMLGAVLAGSAAFWVVQRQHLPASSAAPAPSAPEVAFQIAAASETQIREHAPTSLTVFRLADNPRILVLDFASLHAQGEMLNRVAAFVEKAGTPHDRVLTDSELEAEIHAKGDTVETYYLGHDYAATSLVRFFDVADQDKVQLDPPEEKLRTLLLQEGWFASDVRAGLISLPAAGSDPRITQAVRAAILRHELSHGEFFSNPAYAEYVRRFWLTELTDEERSAVRSFLAREGYDAGDEELMFNEMQAYLMFTDDPVFFRPDFVGLTQQQLAALQARFLAGMPAGWLRDELVSRTSHQNAASGQ